MSRPKRLGGLDENVAESVGRSPRDRRPSSGVEKGNLASPENLISILALRARIWYNKPHESFRRIRLFLRVLSSRVTWLANGAEEIGFRLVCTAGLK